MASSLFSLLSVAACIVVVCTAFSVPKLNNNHYRGLENTIQRRVNSFVSTTTTSRRSSFTSSISSNEDLLPGIFVIDDANDVIIDKIENLQESSYFRLFCVDILASCEYMPQELFECYAETCEVYPVDDDAVPENLRGVDFLEHEFELDGWARWDMPSNDYYDLEEFPDGYTGYNGSEVWEFIHEKICFNGYDYNDDHWKADFNKAISGIHSLISVQVTSGIQEKIEAGEEFTDEEVWRDPKVEFDRRLSKGGEQPMAMENLYFTYMLFLSAAAKAKDKLLADCQSGKIDEDSAAILKGFLSLPVLSDPAVEVVPKKLHEHAVESKNNLWEARMRTRDLLRIVNCVQCNKCRLHGKVAMLGMSTALQIHLGRSGEGGDPNRIHRVELAALLSTIYKLSKAVDYCKRSR